MLFETNNRIMACTKHPFLTLPNTMWLHTCRILNILPEQHNISEKKNMSSTVLFHNIAIPSMSKTISKIHTNY